MIIYLLFPWNQVPVFRFRISLAVFLLCYPFWTACMPVRFQEQGYQVARFIGPFTGPFKILRPSRVVLDRDA